MEEKKNLLTYAGLKKLEDELHDLKVVKRKEVAANADSVKVHFILNYNLCVFKNLLDFFDSCFDISLLILCSIILSILGQITLLSCFFDFFCNFFSFYNRGITSEAVMGRNQRDDPSSYENAD